MNERLQRPQPARTQPIRSWSTLFTAPATGTTATSSPDADAALGDAMARSVELGYRVIDEYIVQGRKAAQRLNDRAYGADALRADAQTLASRMTEYATELTGLWMELAQRALGAGSPASQSQSVATAAAPATPSAPESASTPVPAPAAPPRVTLALHSPYPTEVSIDLRPEAATRRLVVHALRAVDDDAQRLVDVTLNGADPEASLTLRVRVPDGQPGGLYNGMIIDADSGLPLGTVSVRIVSA